MSAVLLTEDTATPSIAEIIDVIGPEATQQLCERLGGLSMSMGRHNREVVAAIGQEALTKLRSYWGSGRLYVPRRATSYQARFEEIRKLRDAGKTVISIAIAMKMSERQVYTALARTKRVAA